MAAAAAPARSSKQDLSRHSHGTFMAAGESSTSYVGYPKGKPFLNSELHRSPEKPIIPYPESNSRAIFSALKNLQEKIRKLELQRIQAEENMKTLSKEATEYKKVVDRQAKSKESSHTDVSKHNNELLSQLSAAESRCALLEKQLEYMKQMVRKAENDRTAVLEKQLSVEGDRQLEKHNLQSKLEKLDMLEHEYTNLTTMQAVAEKKIQEMEQKLCEEQRYRKLMQEKAAQLHSPLRKLSPPKIHLLKRTILPNMSVEVKQKPRSKPFRIKKRPRKKLQKLLALLKGQHRRKCAELPSNPDLQQRVTQMSSDALRKLLKKSQLAHKVRLEKARQSSLTTQPKLNLQPKTAMLPGLTKASRMSTPKTAMSRVSQRSPKRGFLSKAAQKTNEKSASGEQKRSQSPASLSHTNDSPAMSVPLSGTANSSESSAVLPVISNSSKKSVSFLGSQKLHRKAKSLSLVKGLPKKNVHSPDEQQSLLNKQVVSNLASAAKTGQLQSLTSRSETQKLSQQASCVSKARLRSPNFRKVNNSI
ncbi:centrosomal protein of 57 kDa isoform X1 [Pleurodeles waltl]|uniref:centrosomal protein of 57 kDa isoform X1 n=1 Tax=Pleurodeles waltl TaxID=8319 RepID=UPI00370953DC